MSRFCMVQCVVVRWRSILSAVRWRHHICRIW